MLICEHLYKPANSVVNFIAALLADTDKDDSMQTSEDGNHGNCSQNEVGSNNIQIHMEDIDG